MMDEKLAAIESCKRDIADLKAQIEQLRENADQTPLAEAAEAAGVQPFNCQLRKRRILKGHYGKVYALAWGPDSRQMVSASQDGKLIIWNAFTTNKLHAIPLRSCWIMTCDYSPSGQLVACGGLDNLCSLYKLPSTKVDTAQSQKVLCELAQHEGYLSCCRFIGDSEILTSSGDGSCILWDVDSQAPKALFDDHMADVMSVSADPRSGLFVSGSTDATAKLWDFRMHKACVKTFVGHESDINSVQFFPDGSAFGSGSDDSTCRLFDNRAYGQLNKYCSHGVLCGVTSVAFSKTGQVLFAGYDDYNLRVWDTRLGDLRSDIQGHDNRVSAVAMSSDGQALATASWDTLCAIWA